MKYKCLIVDDEELARELIVTHLSQLDQFKVVATCESALEANKVLANKEVDLLFLDIEMPVLKGTDFLKSLHKVPKVIFTTAYRDYALEGFELNAVDYLLKPIVFERFFQAIQKFLESQPSSVQASELTKTDEIKQEDYLFVQAKRKNIKIQLSEILYIESLKDYISIHLRTDNVQTKASISSFYKKLDHRFLRIHRSFIVNKDVITAFTKHDIEIGSTELPIGDSYKQEVMQALSI
ncbi:LytR/AlgR family response regulator transcription factor [Marivirga arenosa]|uniref:LytTR family DNA-binding domain-containing protein n=1 Tax=Marivirga arenosa TaxID=3059076 RepID=A0AA51ZY32_9BACT|nr:LytTR family DNA-binding domain-containing protein [Marivirga sp. BKB1-2]WNB18869.1 LytTR family DNA-binding domain-containing protein [Marivirga sp. BKB1-2]